MLGTGLLLLRHVIVAVGAIQEIPSPPDFGSIIQRLATQFAAVATKVLGTIDSSVISISRLAYVSALLIGVMLYTTHLENRVGKDLMKGGLVLAFLSEFVFPLISKI